MKRKILLIAYVAAMSLLTTAVLFYGNRSHDNCPVCNHSFASEGFADVPELKLVNQ